MDERRKNVECHLHKGGNSWKGRTREYCCTDYSDAIAKESRKGILMYRYTVNENVNRASYFVNSRRLAPSTHLEWVSFPGRVRLVTSIRREIPQLRRRGR